MENEAKRKAAEKERLINESVRMNSEIHRKLATKHRLKEDEATLRLLHSLRKEMLIWK